MHNECIIIVLSVMLMSWSLSPDQDLPNNRTSKAQNAQNFIWNHITCNGIKASSSNQSENLSEEGVWLSVWCVTRRRSVEAVFKPSLRCVLKQGARTLQLNYNSLWIKSSAERINNFKYYIIKNLLMMKQQDPGLYPQPLDFCRNRNQCWTQQEINPIITL